MNDLDCQDVKIIIQVLDQVPTEILKTEFPLYHSMGEGGMYTVSLSEPL